MTGAKDAGRLAKRTFSGRAQALPFFLSAHVLPGFGACPGGRSALISRRRRPRSGCVAGRIERKVALVMTNSSRREPILNVPGDRGRCCWRCSLPSMPCASSCCPMRPSSISCSDFAFMPARYDSACPMVALPGGLRRGCLDLRHLRADPRRSDASRLQRGLAAGLCTPGGAPVRRGALSRCFVWSLAVAGALAHLLTHAGTARADGRRLRRDFRHDGGGDRALSSSRAARSTAGAATRRRRSRAGRAAAGRVARSARARISRASGSGSICCSGSARCRSPATSRAWRGRPMSAAFSPASCCSAGSIRLAAPAPERIRGRINSRDDCTAQIGCRPCSRRTVEPYLIGTI